MATNIFMTLPVKDIVRAKVFFSLLGYSFNSQFTYQNASCLVINWNDNYGFPCKNLRHPNAAAVLLALDADVVQQV